MTKLTDAEKFKLACIVRARGDIPERYRLLYDALIDFYRPSIGECFPSYNRLGRPSPCTGRQRCAVSNIWKGRVSSLSTALRVARATDSLFPTQTMC